jgi:hypothetical protein
MRLIPKFYALSNGILGFPVSSVKMLEIKVECMHSFREYVYLVSYTLHNIRLTGKGSVLHIRKNRKWLRSNVDILYLDSILCNLCS